MTAGTNFGGATAPPLKPAQWWRSAAGVVLATALLAACGGGEPAVEGEGETLAAPRLSAIVVSPADLKVTVGLTRTVAAQARDQYGAVMTGIAFNWASSNAAVATVVDGVVTGRAAGSVSITASSAGVTSNAVALDAIAAPRGTVAIDKASLFLTAAGQSARLAAQVLRRARRAGAGQRAVVVERAGNRRGRCRRPGDGARHRLGDDRGRGRRRRSPPTLAIVAAPQAGALLVTDAQVVAVGPILRLAVGAAVGVGAEYEVTLAGVAAPAPGTVMLAAESAPVAGKVVASTGRSGRGDRHAGAGAAARSCSRPTTSASTSISRASGWSPCRIAPGRLRSRYGAARQGARRGPRRRRGRSTSSNPSRRGTATRSSSPS